MLDIVLQFLKDELNVYLQMRTGVDTAKVKLTRIVDDAGKWGFEQDMVGANIIHLEEERTLKSQLPQYSQINGQHVITEPELKLNLYVMFAAHFKVYEEALKYISLILLYFQSHRSFAPDQFPGLDARVEKLTLELQSLNFEQLNEIWAYIGGKQLPSLIYKLRLVVLQPEAPSLIQAPLTQISTMLRRQ